MAMLSPFEKFQLFPYASQCCTVPMQSIVLGTVYDQGFRAFEGDAAVQRIPPVFNFGRARQITPTHLGNGVVTLITSENIFGTSTRVRF